MQETAYAQCFGGTFTGTINPTTTFQTIPCITGGQYYNFNAVAGNLYTFTFCNNGGSATFDTEITILDNTGLVAQADNDDACGTQSELSWTCPTTGTYRVLVMEFPCTAGATCATLAYRCSVPGPGASCANPFVVPSLPFSQTALTTCGMGDDFSSADACGSVYMGGDDMVFTYTSAGNEYINVNLSNTMTYTGILVTDGCPSSAATNCVTPQSGGGLGCAGGGATNEASGGNPFGTWFLPTAGTYYITISTFPAPQCTPFDISITPGSGGGSGGGLGNTCYTVNQAIPYSPDPYNTGTQLVFPDDEFSAIVNMPFTFCFMGYNYNQFVVSSNGYVTFETACTGQFSNYTTSAIPTTTPDDIRNAIMGPWQDIDPSVGGSIRYQTLGTAPNRRMVVNFNQIPMFSVACNSQLFTGQITMYETSNVIETYIANKTICASWNSGNAVQGLHDATGTVAVTLPGRNNTNWAVTNDAVRYTPNCAPCLIVLNAAYKNLVGTAQESGNLIEWETLFEDDVDHFVLERSLDGQNFVDVAEMRAEGNVDKGATYQIMDETPYSPNSYYRLREMSIDGEASHSEVISVRRSAIEAPLRNLYVDQDAQRLVIETEFQSALPNVKISIVDGIGRELMVKNMAFNAGAQKSFVDISSLSAGYYIFKLTDGVKVHDAQKFAINQ